MLKSPFEAPAMNRAMDAFSTGESSHTTADYNLRPHSRCRTLALNGDRGRTDYADFDFYNGDVPGSVELLKRSALPTLSR
jgi:hypothetical protein